MTEMELTRESSESVVVEEPAGFDMDVLVGYILMIGVGLSVLLIAAGVVWHWLATGRLGLDYSIRGMSLFQFVLRDGREEAAGMNRPRLLVNMGFATLMLTPYIRVLASMLYFAFGERNKKYTAFTAFVFLVLSYTLLLR